MKKIIILCLLLFSSSLLAQSNVARTKFFFNALKTLGDSPTSCENEEAVLMQANYSQENKSYKRVRIRGINPVGQATFQNVKTSVLTKDQADKLFEEFKKVSYMPNKYLEDGCYARAHELALIAQNNGINLGKAFMLPAEGDLLYPKNLKNARPPRFHSGFSGWKYHAVSYVLVQNGDKIEPYVFDIGVSDKIQSFSEWKSNLSTSNRARIVVKDRPHIYPDSNFTSANTSIINRLQETQDLIDDIGMNEFQFRTEQGWL